MLSTSLALSTNSALGLAVWAAAVLVEETAAKALKGTWQKLFDRIHFFKF